MIDSCVFFLLCMNTHLAVHVSKKKIKEEALPFSESASDGNDDDATVLDLILVQDLRESIFVEFETVVGISKNYLYRPTRYLGISNRQVVHRERFYSLA